jgi:hypothetical protein
MKPDYKAATENTEITEKSRELTRGMLREESMRAVAVIVIRIALPDLSVFSVISVADGACE